MADSRVRDPRGGGARRRRNVEVAEAEYQKFLLVSFALHGLLSPTTSEYFVFQRVERASPIPSPFATMPGVHNEYRKTLKGSSREVVSAFDQFKRMKVANIRKRPVGADGFVALFGMIVKARRGHSQIKTGEVTLIAFPPSLNDEQHLLMIPEEEKERWLMVRRAKPRFGTETGYFLVNVRFDNLYVNGQHVLQGTVLGPLPEFAVIECGRYVVFWWKTREAYDYYPGSSSATPEGQPRKGTSEPSTTNAPASSNPPSSSNQAHPTRPASKGAQGELKAASIASGKPTKKRPRSPEVAEDLSQRPQKVARPTQLPPPTKISIPRGAPKEWARIYEEGLRRHRNLSRRDTSSTHRPHTILRERDLSDEDLIYAIASIWEPVHNTGRPFAFAGLDFFTRNDNIPPQARLHKIGVVGGPNDFIMPILLHRQRATGAVPLDQTNSIGHIVLVHAYVRSPDNNTFGVEIYDSSFDLVSEGDVMQAVTRLLNNADWPWLPPSPGLVRPQLVYDHVHWHNVPQQQIVPNTCGIHAILNAYALLLGIPITQDLEGIVPTVAQEFYAQSLEIINLAMAGHMDSLTIMAFMTTWLYTHPQALPFSMIYAGSLPPLKSLPPQPTKKTDPRTGTTIHQVQARRMNGAILVDILQEEKHITYSEMIEPSRYSGPVLDPRQQEQQDVPNDPNEQSMTGPFAGTGAQTTAAEQSTTQAQPQPSWRQQAFQPPRDYEYPDPDPNGFANNWDMQDVIDKFLQSAPPPPLPASTAMYPPQPAHQPAPGPTATLAPPAQPAPLASSSPGRRAAATAAAAAATTTPSPTPPTNQEVIIQSLLANPTVQAAAAQNPQTLDLEHLAREALNAANWDFEAAVSEMTSALGLEELGFQTSDFMGDFMGDFGFGGDGSGDSLPDRFGNLDTHSNSGAGGGAGGSRPNFRSTHNAKQNPNGLRRSRRMLLRSRPPGPASTSASTSTGKPSQQRPRAHGIDRPSYAYPDRIKHKHQQHGRQFLPPPPPTPTTTDYWARALQYKPSSRPVGRNDVRPSKNARLTGGSAATAISGNTSKSSGSTTVRRTMPPRKCKSIASLTGNSARTDAGRV